MSVSDLPPESQDEEIETAIASMEESLTNLKQRHAQVKRDQIRLQELLARQQQLKGQPSSASKTLIKQELKQLRQQIQEVELNLESRLWKFKELKEPFWQAVRFGGLGIVLGWWLKTLAG